MVNAVKIAARIIERLPQQTLSPETTEGREGYVHPHHVSGNEEAASIKFLIRDFTVEGLKEYEALIKKISDDVTGEFPGARSEVKVTESYRNMKVISTNTPTYWPRPKKPWPWPV